MLLAAYGVHGLWERFAMPQKKKLQVFVSSTYEDLKEERQAAVEAILNAGHIPAGMELFAAGDESQMAVIRRWIDESDVFLLILGGRYGSLESESGKSYIHLEYEYALEQSKPLFAVVITENYLETKIGKFGSGVMERHHQAELREFRTLVKSKMVRFWEDPRDIKLAIHEKILELLRDRELVGWVPGIETVDTAPLAAEIARLGKENADLRGQLERASKATETYNGLSFDELYKLLLNTGLSKDFSQERHAVPVEQISQVFGDGNTSLIHLFWYLKDIFQLGVGYPKDGQAHVYALKLEAFGLIDISSRSPKQTQFILNQTGRQFLLRLRTVRNASQAEQYVLNANGR